MVCSPSWRLGAFSTAVFALISAAAQAAVVPASNDTGPVRFAAGVFVQGANDGAEDERPRRERTLPAFRIDRTEVTRGAYAKCVAAKRCPKVPGLPVDGAPSDLSLPMTDVSWDEAKSYCRFVKGRLPSEAEWERAARGVAGRTYPWGEELACDRANWGNFDNEGPCAGTTPGKPVPVGSYPSGATPEGLMDLGGNVWEWVQDVYEADRARRVVKGGSCCSYFVPPRSANRNAWAPTHRDADLGFRCAYR